MVREWVLGIIIPLLIFFLCCSPAAAQGGDQVLNQDEIIKEQLHMLELDEIEALIGDINRQAAAYVPELSLGDLISGDPGPGGL